MRRLPTVLILAILVVPAMTGSRAAAEPVEAGLFSYFRTICAPNPDPDQGAARALTAGFAPSKKKPRAAGMDEVRGFEKSVGDHEFFVIVGRAKGKPKDDMPASLTIACGVGLKAKDEAALAAGRKWVGVPVSRSVMGVGFHAFRQTGSSRAALSFEDKPATRAAVLAGDLNVLTVSGLGGVSLLMLSRTKAAT